MYIKIKGGNMIKMNVLGARLIEEGSKLHPIVKFADEMFLSGMREADLNLHVLKKYCPYEYVSMFNNRLRDLERGFRKPGERA
jgi:hypothetical protein